jgi:hypothetical protein
VTFYSRYGDVFALVCVLLTLVGTADAIAFRWRRRPAEAK